ncbi:MAG: hypothetical protein K6T39_12920, partial [Anoxybacillus ayderensis]|nr:hypothetical protein [Anoxybacillus ayderensis]
ESIYDCSYNQETIVSFDDDYETLLPLKNYNKESIGLIVLRDGQYAQDFAQCNGYRVNPETLELEFSYPDPNQPSQEPIYQKPLTERLTEMEQRQELIQKALDDLLLGGSV